MRIPDFFDEVLLQKRDELINMGNNPYPYDYHRENLLYKIVV